MIVTKYKNRAKIHKGFMSGDIIKADIPREEHKRRHTGRITVRNTGNFGLVDRAGECHDISCKYMSVI